jgi:3-ketosteroid 9alpha-monooxygenase subunit A
MSGDTAPAAGLDTPEREAIRALRAKNVSAPKPGYPEGWFQVAYSDEVAAGQVVALRYFGRDLVMFRTEAGRVQVLDAFCAHLGAHLGVGGTVAGERLRCPFHAWEYGVEGVCQSVPYSPHLPQAAVAAWPTVERSGLVMIWHSLAANPPSWDPPHLTEYGDPAWIGYIRERFVVRTTAQEVIENIFDVVHGQFVHGNANGMALPTAEFSYDGPVSVARLKIDLPSVGASTANTVEIFGLGLVVNHSVGIGAKAFWSTNTPIDADTLEVRFSMLTALSTPSDPTGEMSRRSGRATTAEFAKDIPIWEHKIYRADPAICAGDGPIGRFRLWAEQFYPPQP